jgi:uncharacterized membrane protein
MTAEILLILLLAAASLVATGVGALVLAAFGATGWLVLLAFAVTAALAFRFALADAEWPADEFGEDTRAG